MQYIDQQTFHDLNKSVLCTNVMDTAQMNKGIMPLSLSSYHCEQ